MPSLVVCTPEKCHIFWHADLGIFRTLFRAAQARPKAHDLGRTSVLGHWNCCNLYNRVGCVQFLRCSRFNTTTHFTLDFELTVVIRTVCTATSTDHFFKFGAISEHYRMSLLYRPPFFRVSPIRRDFISSTGMITLKELLNRKQRKRRNVTTDKKIFCTLLQRPWFTPLKPLTYVPYTALYRYDVWMKW